MKKETHVIERLSLFTHFITIMRHHYGSTPNEIQTGQRSQDERPEPILRTMGMAIRSCDAFRRTGGTTLPDDTVL